MLTILTYALLILPALCLALFAIKTGAPPSLNVAIWRFRHRKQCPGPFNELRREMVRKNIAFQSADFRVESYLLDLRVQCPQCLKVHQFHTTTSARIATEK